MNTVRPTRTLVVDRTACRGAGLCATLLPDDVTLDEWGYPVLAGGSAAVVDEQDGERALRLCPARALRRPRVIPA